MEPIVRSVAERDPDSTMTQIFRDALDAGLTVFVDIEHPSTKTRNDVVHKRASVAVNEDGTRGAVLMNKLRARGMMSDEEAEAFAFRQGGGIPDVD